MNILVLVVLFQKLKTKKYKISKRRKTNDYLCILFNEIVTYKKHISL